MRGRAGPCFWMVVLFPLAVWASAAPVATEIPREEYKARRTALRNTLRDGVVILYGRTERERGDLRNAFFQESNFFYLAGWREPGAALALTPSAEWLFLPRRNPVRQRYTGRKASPEDENIRQLTGFEQVSGQETLEAQLPRLLEGFAKVYTLVDQPAAERLKPLLGGRELADASKAIGRLRMVKSPREVELLRRSVERTLAAHRAGWNRMAPGMFEYQIAATLSNVWLEEGCERNAYAPIIASGPNGVILHYQRNERRIAAGDLVLLDAGAECSGYAADITRTVPAGGNFAARHKELYELVLGAQQAALAAVKPGVTLRGLTEIAREWMNSRGKPIGGNPPGRYFTHGIGHHVGLDVHDPGDVATPLEPGMVITIEPGLYIPEEGVGIRVEDMVLVTEQGPRILSEALPRQVEAIEKAMRRQ